MFRHVHLYSLGTFIFIIALFLSPITANLNPSDFLTDFVNPQIVIVSQENSQTSGNFSTQPARSIFSPSAATFPFYDGFESGDLGPSWEAYTTVNGRVQVSDSYPYEGNYSLLLDATEVSYKYSHADAILTIDLEGQTQVNLDFWWHKFTNNDHSLEGVYISADNGTTWSQIFYFSSGTSGWYHSVVDLDAKATEHGLAFNDHFKIKFQYYSQGPIPNYGYAIDEVKLRSNAAPMLRWPGDQNYSQDGLHPETGDPSDTYVYRIQYVDLDDDPPGEVNLHIEKNGSAITGSPFAMICESGDYADGVICSYTKDGIASGTNYTYFFDAEDDQGNSAEATDELDAPNVNSAVYLPIVVFISGPPASAPLLDTISNPGGSYTFTVSWSSVTRATGYILVQDTESTFPNPKTIYNGTETSTSVSVGDTNIYYYRVKATNLTGESPWSNIQSTSVTVEQPACPTAGRWVGKTNWDKSLVIWVKDTPTCIVDKIELYFGICNATQTTFHEDVAILNGHFYSGDEADNVRGDFTSPTNASGDFYLSGYCTSFPPMWVDYEGTWTATYSPEK